MNYTVVNYSVSLAKPAKKEIAETYRYLYEHTGPKADHWLEGVHAAIRSLSEMPKRCPLAKENGTMHRQEVRQLLFQDHRILFIVQGRRVSVIHVRHGARGP